MTPEMNFPNDIEAAAEVGTNKNKSARKDVGQQSLTQMNEETYDFRSSQLRWSILTLIITEKYEKKFDFGSLCIVWKLLFSGRFLKCKTVF